MPNNTGYLYKISRGNIATAAKQRVPKSAPRRASPVGDAKADEVGF